MELEFCGDGHECTWAEYRGEFHAHCDNCGAYLPKEQTGDGHNDFTLDGGRIVYDFPYCDKCATEYEAEIAA